MNEPSMTMVKPLLKVTDLSVTFKRDNGMFEAVDRMDYTIESGQIVALVGESGCGKSVSAQAVMGLLNRNGTISGGTIEFDGSTIDPSNDTLMDQLRGNQISMIFQDPLSTLDPLFTIGNQLMETIHAHDAVDRTIAKKRCVETLKDVGFADPLSIFNSYPHTLSGGMRQRCVIAMALVNHPKLLIADEPTTALDVTIQAQIMNLLKDLRDKYGMAILLITHDMGVVATMADKVLVMYAGQIIESASVMDLFSHPLHPYTKALMASVPSIDGDGSTTLSSIRGNVSANYDTLIGCRFLTRCPFALQRCMQPIPWKDQGCNHRVRCINTTEVEL